MTEKTENAFIRKVAKTENQPESITTNGKITKLWLDRHKSPEGDFDYLKFTFMPDDEHLSGLMKNGCEIAYPFPTEITEQHLLGKFLVNSGIPLDETVDFELLLLNREATYTFNRVSRFNHARGETQTFWQPDRATGYLTLS